MRLSGKGCFAINTVNDLNVRVVPSVACSKGAIVPR